MAANPRMLNATQTKDAFGFDKNWYIVNGFNPAQDVLDIIGTAYAVEINDAQSGIGGTLILKDKPPASTENLTTEQILSLDGIFLQGVAAANITAQNVRQGGTLESLANPNDKLAGVGNLDAPALTNNTIIEQPTQNTGGLVTNNNTSGLITNNNTTVVEQNSSNIVRNPNLTANAGINTATNNSFNSRTNTAETVNILNEKSIFGTNGKDLGEISVATNNGNTQEARQVLNTRGDDDTLSVSAPGSYITGTGNDVVNVETAPRIINIMASRGADTVAISGGATNTNNSSETSGKSVNVLLGGSNQNGDGDADTVAIDVNSLDSNTRIQIAQWDTNDKIKLGNARLNYSVVMLQNGMSQADLTSADNGAVISTTLNATDRAAFETMLDVSNT
ncbi:MAG: hypothetical protein INF44_03860 [Thalassospira sp.]|nr:hypothetical protein [Thalassospira sp.]